MVKGNDTSNDTTAAPAVGEDTEFEGFIMSVLEGMAEITGFDFQVQVSC